MLKLENTKTKEIKLEQSSRKAVINLDINELMKNEKIMDLLIQKIVEEVIRRLQNKPKVALVCFAGGAIGYTESVESLKKLKADGWQLKVFLSDAALSVFGEDIIKEALGIDTIHSAATKTPQRELYEEVDSVIIATSTINTVAKLANGITDNEMLTLINHGIMAGKPVICSVDGACPDNKTRAALGMGHTPKGYKKMLRNNILTLMGFGFNIVASEDLYDACVGTPAAKEIEIEEKSCPVSEAKPKKVAVLSEDPFEDDELANKKIISRVDILKKRGQKLVKVSESAIVTQYAIDAAKELNIIIERV